MQNTATITHNSGLVVCCEVPNTVQMESLKLENLINILVVLVDNLSKLCRDMLYFIQFHHTESRHPQIRPAPPPSQDWRGY